MQTLKTMKFELILDTVLLGNIAQLHNLCFEVITREMICCALIFLLSTLHKSCKRTFTPDKRSILQRVQLCLNFGVRKVSVIRQ